MFYINLYIAFIHEDSLTKVEQNVFGYENMSIKNFGFIFENKMAAMAHCSKIINMS